jgi:hypothetical protein
MSIRTLLRKRFLATIFPLKLKRCQKGEICSNKIRWPCAGGFGRISAAGVDFSDLRQESIAAPQVTTATQSTGMKK